MEGGGGGLNDTAITSDMLLTVTEYNDGAEIDILIAHPYQRLQRQSAVQLHSLIICILC